MLHRVDVKELAFGLFLIALALVAFGSTGALNVGSAADMGPGFVPRTLAWIILGFGAAFCVTSLLKAPEPLPEVAWRPLIRDPSLDRPVCRAVLDPRPGCGLHRLRAGRRYRHGARAVAPAPAVRPAAGRASRRCCS